MNTSWIVLSPKTTLAQITAVGDILAKYGYKLVGDGTERRVGNTVGEAVALPDSLRKQLLVEDCVLSIEERSA